MLALKELLEPKTLLIDGKSLLKHSYFGAKHLYHEGNHIGGLFAFFSISRKLINFYNVKKMFIFWEGKESGRLRYNLYEGYKANRKDYANGGGNDDEDDFIIQMERTKQYAEELYIRQYEDKYLEGDDGVAFYCNKNKNEKIIICSSDRDLLQLVDSNVYQYVINKDELVGIDNFSEYFGHHYKNHLLVKALVGDSSDNVNGVKGIGEKTLLNHFPEFAEREVSMEYLIHRIEEIQSDRKTRYKSLDNIIDAYTNGLIDRNIKLMDLENPIIGDEQKEELYEIFYSPMDPDDRNEKNLLSMMMDDGFIEAIPGGRDGYIEFLKPFKGIADNEKRSYFEMIKDY
jgi:DNA polymerase-1